MQRLDRETPCGRLSVWIPSDPPISFERQIEDGKLYEPATVATLCDTILSGDVFYDIGARWGYFSRLAARRGARVVAYEPGERECLPVLRRNADAAARDIDIRPVSVDPITPLAAPPPDVVKIDVEGDEHGVFRALRSSGRLPSTLVIEMHPAYIKDAGTSQAALVTDLREWGYHLEFTDDHREKDAAWHSVATDDLPTGVTDYLLVASRS